MFYRFDSLAALFSAKIAFLSDETYSSVDPLPEASFPDVMERRSHTVRPNQLVDVKALLAAESIFRVNPILHHKHLRSR